MTIREGPRDLDPVSCLPSLTTAEQKPNRDARVARRCHNLFQVLIEAILIASESLSLLSYYKPCCLNTTPAKNE
jgi:hypothetical protein